MSKVVIVESPVSPIDQKAVTQAEEVLANRAVHVALMPDAHLGYIMPVGGVAAYRNAVNVPGVGYDIACGNCAVKTNLHWSALDDRMWEELADDIQSHISFGVGRKNVADDAPTDHHLFNSELWGALASAAGKNVATGLRDKARTQLGTVGSGNHYVDVFYDEDGWIWVGVHFGSRGLGHSIATGFLNLGITGRWDGKCPEQPLILSLDSLLGLDYWACMELAGQFAYAGREWVCQKVVDLLGAEIVETVHNNHNFAWREEHFGEEVVVVRKGATPAFPGQKGFVGGSMGDISVILEGKGTEAETPDREDDGGYLLRGLQEMTLFSTVHGAGRVMSRTQAAGKERRRKVWACGQRDCDGVLAYDTPRGADGSNPKCDLCGSRTRKHEIRERVTEGLVSREGMDAWLKEKRVILRGGGLDEAPQAYRRLPDVLEAARGTVSVLHTLTPVVVVMAGADEYDPYKD